jgi:inosine/xanthosine triphosphate pyrophosphatase family protein
MRLVYVTSSQFKSEENRIFVQEFTLPDGSRVADRFEFEIRPVPVKETLEVDLSAMVAAEVKEAYRRIGVPCIVEHAGLIFEDYLELSYPGGLTKPMWDTLRDRFVDETASAGKRAVARAVVAYCDGLEIKTFTGETRGEIAAGPRGTRDFYWDTIFVPDDPTGAVQGKTYAEIADDAGFGLTYKVMNLSQSSRAMTALLLHLLEVGTSPLWTRYR